MEITTPPNPSGFAKKPKSKKGTPGRNRKSKNHSLRRTTLNMYNPQNEMFLLPETKCSTA